MTKIKSLNRRLISAILVLIMMVTSLIGTTFAWFTDSVTSGNNIITTGRLDVELYWSKTFGGSWNQVGAAGNEPIFTNDKWEPGYTEVRYIKVANEGNLAFKYAMSIVPVGEVGELAKVIDVYYITDPTEDSVKRNNLDTLTPAGKLSDVINSTGAEGVLLPEGEEHATYRSGETVFAMVLKLPESVGNEYMEKSVGDSFSVRLMATQFNTETDSFDTDYDKDVAFPPFEDDKRVVYNLENGQIPAGGITFGDAEQGINATVPETVALEEGATRLTLTVDKLDETKSNVVLDANEIILPLNVHIDGISETNTAPIVIDLGPIAPKGLNIGNYTLYHVEDGVTQTMTLVASAAELTAHNTFTYDAVTGNVSVAMATFSEVAVVADTENKWEGNRDYSWYTNAVAALDGEAATEYVIANADQLAAFGAIVGGMDGQAQDSFTGKTVKLISDINLGDKESENNDSIIFYPIGYYNSEGTYERTNTAITSGLRNFEGIFDGNGHTVSNFYQNTWEMKGDHDWYSPEEQYYRDGMGLFGRIYKGTVKNLTVKNFSSDGEIATTGTIAAYAEGATFENIAIFDCNPRVYNIGNGGIVGCVGWYAKEADLKTTFKNITVDNSNKISALWGSYDVACGGIVGQYYPTSGQTSAGQPANAGISFVNCHVSAQMDVYNDVCANYQYYAYRYTGMMIGSIRENLPADANGHVYPNMEGISAKDCTVHFGDWNDYYYCELVDNTTASYTHDHQMSRLVEIKSIDGTTITYLDGTTGTVPSSGRANYVIVDYTKGHGTENATCYHFKDGAVWTHDMAGTQTGIDENGDGQDDLKEDKQHIYLEFNNLVTGYGWGVTSKGIDDLAGVTILDREVGNSYVKFEKKEDASDTYMNGKPISIGSIFGAAEIDDEKLSILNPSVSVTVSPVGDESTVSAVYVANTTDWTQGTLTFSGIGTATITITDYYFCTPTTITVTIKEKDPVEKFEVKLNNGDFLHRVGNQNAVKLDSLFKAKAGETIGTVSVTVEALNGTSASGAYTSNATWTNGTIQFSGTGVVKVTITDNDYCTLTELLLEVVDATNATTATSATANNVVLLGDISSGFTVSGRYAVYGNGFTLNYTGNGQYLNNGLKQGIVTVSENGSLDNLKIKATIYPEAYLYYGDARVGNAVKDGPSSVEGDKTRYHYQLSAVAASGNATISNCYIYGGRNNIFINTGDVTVKDTVLECGVVANVQIQSNSSHTVTFENVTTIQYQVNPTIGDTTKVMLGAGILVGPETTENPQIVLNGDFKQYNWVTSDDQNAVSDEAPEMIIQGALNATEFNHTVNDKTASNLGIIYMNTFDMPITDNTGLPYEKGEVKISSVTGQVYSLKNATADQIYSDYENADKDTVNGLYEPQFKYSADLGGQYVGKTDDGDEFCYREGDTIYVMFPAGDTKELDLAALVNITKYAGQNLNIVVACKDENGNAVTVTDGKISLSAAGEYTVTYTVTDTVFFDKDGNEVTDTIIYSWNATVSVSLKDAAVPNAYFEFDSTKQKMGYYKPTIGDVKQYLPFLAGLKIYDYNGEKSYLRFDGDADFNKVASVTITGYTSNEAYVEIKLTDGGVINTKFLARADSGGGSTYTGKIKTSNNTIYFVSDAGTSNKDTTTTAAYWYVDYYKFTGNNGVAIQSAQQTFNSTGSSASTPSGSFSTTIKYTVTYDANSGNCGQTVGYATSASAAVTLPTPTRSGYIFSGWYTAASGGTRVGGAGDSYTPSANITLYAQWGKPCTVTYNANGGSCGTASEKYTGTALTLPTPTRDGYWFIGWYDAAEGGTKIGDAGATYNPSGEIILYAHWQEKIEYTVTYNANGGSCGTASATYQGTALTLPTPTRTGYEFLGWYTAASGGTKIGDAGATYIPNANVTLYAQWEKIAYTITVTTSNATVSGVTNGQTAYYGDTITFTVTYSKNSNKTTTVTDANGNTVTTTGSYTFTMPASNVTIEASSSGSCVTADTLVTLADGTQKRIDEVTYADKLLVWDFDNGVYTIAGASIIENHGYDYNDIIKLTFDNGATVKVVNVHGFFDADLNKWVDINADNAQNYVGHNFVQQDGESYKTAKLVSVEVTQEYVEAWSILTADYYNCIMEGMFTVTPPATEQLAFFEIGADMKYDAEAKQADIEKYGLYTYDEFAHLMTEEQFEVLNVAEIKIAIAKGLITYEELLWLIATYAN